MKRIALCLWVILVVGACDRDDGDRSPPVTFGTAGAPVEETAEEEAESAEAELEELMPATERLAEPTPEQEALMMEARTAFLTDDYETAEVAFRELARSEPVSGATVSATLALGQIFVETGRPQEALEFFEEVEENLEETPELLLVVARVYKDLGQPQQALQAYDTAYMARQDYLFILTEMAEILIQEGEEDRAAQLLLHYEERLAQMAVALGSPDQISVQQRAFVVEVFSMLHDERAHDALVMALDDPDAQVRLHAAVALGDLLVMEAEPRLRRLAVDDRSEEVRRAAREAIQTLQSVRE